VSTIAIYYYYSAGKLILILPSHKGWEAARRPVVEEEGMRSGHWLR